MKKFAVLFLCLLLIIGGALPVFAAESVQSWLDNAREDEQDRIEEIENHYYEKNDETDRFGTCTHPLYCNAYFL